MSLKIASQVIIPFPGRGLKNRLSAEGPMRLCLDIFDANGMVQSGSCLSTVASEVMRRRSSNHSPPSTLI